MWSKSQANTFSKLLKEWKTTTVPKNGKNKGKERERYVHSIFIKWVAQKNGYGKFLNDIDEQYKSRPSTNFGSADWFCRCLLDLNFCELCSKNIKCRPGSRLCGTCLKTEKGKQYAHNKAFEAMVETNKREKSTINKKRRETSRKRYGTDFPWQNKKVQAKKKNNYLAEHGVTHHFHRPEIFEKQQRSSENIKQLRIGTKVFEYQGYEDIALKQAVKKYGVANIVSQFSKAFVPISLSATSYYIPDFYIKGKFYVEVKSDYTLLSNLSKNKAKAKSAIEQNTKVIWLVCYRTPEQVIKLPNNWYTYSRKELKLFLTEHRKISIF